MLGRILLGAALHLLLRAEFTFNLGLIHTFTCWIQVFGRDYVDL